MFHLIVTYREQGRPQRQQTYNSDNLEAALARKVLEMAKQSVRQHLVFGNAYCAAQYEKWQAMRPKPRPWHYAIKFWRLLWR